MRRPLLLAAVLLAAGCSRQAALNYRRCLKLRVGMTREQVLALMGPPEETFPYVEGETLPHLKGRTAYEWGTPASMAAPIRVSLDEASGTAANIRCGDAIITASVYVEPPATAVSTATAGGAPTAPAPGRNLREGSVSDVQSPGRPLTQ